jgi:NAD(P)H-dependent flavin oxidoreductase YrpB (nitropropane dioxygenase family)
MRGGVAGGELAGTRFLLTEESAAHPEYKRRVACAERTLATLLFGVGWPLRHRVIPNAATEHWCSRHELGPRVARMTSQLSAPLGRLMPLDAMGSLMALQYPRLPFFTPALPLMGMPEDAVERSALYAGETVRRLRDIVTAEQAVARLAPP